MKNGRLFLYAIFLCCAMCCLSPCAYADIVDDFSGAAGEYTNLNAVSAASLGWSGVSADTVLVQGGGAVSTALYRCTGATHVTVTLYSVLPSYATKGPDGSFARVRRDGARYPLLYSSAGDTVYLRCAGRVYTGVVDTARGEYTFAACDTLPADCVTYGVSLWYSRDGWREAALTLTADAACTGCFMQRYSAAIPAGATAVRILLTEQNHAPVLGRDVRQRMCMTGSLALGSVYIAGAGAPGNAATDWNVPVDNIFTELPEEGEVQTDDIGEADAYHPYYDAALPDEQTLAEMQEYREAVTDALRQPRADAEETIAIPEEETTKGNIRQKSDASVENDSDSSPAVLKTAVPVHVDSGGTFWKRADTVTAVLTLTVGALAAARILLRGKKQ